MRALSTTILLGLLLTVGVGRAVADSECIQDAKEQRGQCRTECDEDLVIAKDLCRSIDPECAAACRVEHGACRDGVIAELGTCVDGMPRATERGPGGVSEARPRPRVLHGSRPSAGVPLSRRMP